MSYDLTTGRTNRGEGKTSPDTSNRSLSGAATTLSNSRNCTSLCDATAATTAIGHSHVCSVLIVDDSSEVRGLVRAQLSLTEHLSVVGEARNGKEALRRARRLEPDLVLIDIRMPILDGWGTIPLLCELPNDITVVVISAYASADDVDRAFALGASGFIVKGTPRHRVVKEINRALGFSD